MDVGDVADEGVLVGGVVVGLVAVVVGSGVLSALEVSAPEVSEPEVAVVSSIDSAELSTTAVPARWSPQALRMNRAAVSGTPSRRAEGRRCVSRTVGTSREAGYADRTQVTAVMGLDAQTRRSESAG